MILNNKRVLVVGFGESGKSAYKLLVNKGCEVLVFDDNKKNTHKNLFGFFDFAVLSPGIKKSSSVFTFLKQNNIPIMNEIEVGLLFCKAKNIIGVTGTNGKTTVVSLLEHIINSSGKKAIACGNNGRCITGVCEQFEEDDFCIIEFSSFMLEKIKNLHLDYACFLNFKPDHLDYHSSLEEYFNCKKNIFSFQNKKDFSILNADDEKISLIKTKSEIFYFSTRKKVKGVFALKDKVVFNDGEKQTDVLDVGTIPLLGEFNFSNVCACVLLSLLIGLKIKDVQKGVKTFKPVKHRLNLIYNGLFKVFNDSKSTNVASTLASLSCFDKNIILLLGGSDKGENFDDIFVGLKNKVKQIVLFGGNRKKLKYFAIKNDVNNFVVVKKFKKAVLFALKNAEERDVVLFSPASASFDCFKNFEHRGEEFEKIVEKYLVKKQIQQ